MNSINLFKKKTVQCHSKLSSNPSRPAKLWENSGLRDLGRDKLCLLRMSSKRLSRKFRGIMTRWQTRMHSLFAMGRRGRTVCRRCSAARASSVRRLESQLDNTPERLGTKIQGFRFRSMDFVAWCPVTVLYLYDEAPRKPDPPFHRKQAATSTPLFGIRQGQTGRHT